MTEPVNEELEHRIVRALERAPVVEMPADFAARVAHAMPVRQNPMRVPVTSQMSLDIGRSVAAVCVALLFAAMLWLAASSHSNSAVTAFLQCALCSEFVALMLWLILMPRGLR